jgi:hypothetical protein
MSRVLEHLSRATYTDWLAAGIVAAAFVLMVAA